jgi:hypothetical protein
MKTGHRSDVKWKVSDLFFALAEQRQKMKAKRMSNDYLEKEI